MTLAYVFDLDSVKINHHAKYVVQMSLCAILFILQAHTDTVTHTAGRLQYLDHQAVDNFWYTESELIRRGAFLDDE